MHARLPAPKAKKLLLMPSLTWSGSQRSGIKECGEGNMSGLKCKEWADSPTIVPGGMEMFERIKPDEATICGRRVGFAMLILRVSFTTAER